MKKKKFILKSVTLGVLSMVSSMSHALPGIIITDNSTHLMRGINYAGVPFISAVGGMSPYYYGNTTGLPPGININPDGSLSGLTCISPGNYTVAATAYDIMANFASRPVTLAIDPMPVSPCDLSFLNPSIPPAMMGMPYSFPVFATSVSGTNNYSITAGALPPGLMLNPSGIISGMPMIPGVFSFTVTATDIAVTGATASYTYSLTVGGASYTIGPNTVANGTVNTPYIQPLAVSGGMPPYIFNISNGSLPPGLSLNVGGSISGIPTMPGTYGFTISTLDMMGMPSSKDYTITINASPILMTPSALPNGSANVPYSQALTTTGGVGPYNYDLLSGMLPPGMSISFSGANTVFSGTPTLPGNYSFVLRISDNYGGQTEQTFTFSVAPNLALTPSTMPNAVNNMPYSQVLTSTGGTAPYAYSLVSGTLPSGLVLTSAGTLSGIPNMPGNYNFVVRSTDEAGASKDQAYSINVAANIVANPILMPGLANVPYAQTLSATGGTAPYAYAVQSGVLPEGMTLAANGNLSGIPTAPGAASFVVRITDANGATQDQGYTLTVNANMVVSPATVAMATNNVAYTQALSTTGGTAPYAYSLASGSLPTGLTMNAAGVISGTPTVPGNYGFVVKVTDGNGVIQNQNYSITVASNMVLAPAALATGYGTAAYSQTLSTAGGVAPYAYSLASGTLPAGLSLSAAGVISGTPTAGGTYNFVVRVTDESGAIKEQSYSITVQDVNIVFGLTALTDSTQNQAYTANLNATGGTAPYVYSLAAGTLPAGITLSGAGVLSGTPGTTGVSNFAVKVVDANGVNKVQNYTLKVNAALTGVVNTPIQDVSIYTNSSFIPVTFSGGTEPFTFSISPALPDGMHFNTATGEISGTPTGASANKNLISGGPVKQAVATGPVEYTVTVVDATGASASKSFLMAVRVPIVIQINDIVTVVSAKTFSQQITASGGVGPYTFAAVTDLPEGLTLTSDGMLSGRAKTPGNYPVTIRAIDANGLFTDKTFNIVVQERADPTKDADVVGIQNAQREAMKRFADTSVQGIFAHLDKSRECLTSGGEINVRDAQGKNIDLTKLASDPAEAKNCSNVATWFGTSLNYGKDRNHNYKFNSPTYTFGVDYRLAKNAVVGVAIGAANEDNDFASTASNKASNKAAMAYGGLKLNDKLFLDGVLGYGKTSFDTSRSLVDEGLTLTGSRDATQKFGALRLSGKLSVQEFNLTPFVKYQFGKASLDAYSETGDSMLALRYGSSDFSYSNASVGLKVSRAFTKFGGRYEPYVRVEVQNRSTTASNQKMSYVDMPNTEYNLLVPKNSYVNGIFSVGMDYTSIKGISTGVSLTSSSGGGIKNNSLDFSVKVPF